MTKATVTMANSTSATTNLPTSLPTASVLHRSSPTSSKKTRGGGLRGGGERECNFSEKSSKKRSSAAAAAESNAQQTTPTHQQKKPKASSNDHHHHAAASLSSWSSSSPPLSFGASTTAAQTNDDTNGTFGPPASLASKPSPPQEEPNVNPFQRLDEQSATNDLYSSSPHSHSSSNSIPTITPTSPFRSCCINIPKPSNKKYSSDRGTFLTKWIPNQILPTVDNHAIWNILEQIGTITHNEDVRGRDDGQKKPFNQFILLRLNGRPVMRFPPWSTEVSIIKNLYPKYQNIKYGTICDKFQQYYSADGKHHDCLWNGLEVSLVKEMLWYSEVGIVGDNEELLRNHIAERTNALAPPFSHWSGLPDIEYSTRDIEVLQTFAPLKYTTFLRNLSDTEMSLVNLLAQTSRELTPDSSRSSSALPNAVFARNDTQTSASFGDVVARYSDVLARFDSSVSAFLSGNKNDMGRISMWDETALTQLCSVKRKGKGKKEEPQRCLDRMTLNWGGAGNSLAIYALFPNGQRDRIHTQLRIVTLCASYVFSFKSMDEMENLLVGIYWNAWKIRQRFTVARLVIDKFPSARQDISSAILGYTTTKEIPPRPKCLRPGCNNIAAPHPDLSKRGGKYDNKTCNEPACANLCAWHVNGVRCTQPRISPSRGMFCSGIHCNNLHAGTQKSFLAERKAREQANEVFC